MRRRAVGLTLVAAFACGDDGGSGGTDTDASTGSGSTGTSTSTTAGPGTTTEATSTGTTSSTIGTSTTSAGTEGRGSTGEPVEMPVGASGAFRHGSTLSFTVFDIAPHPDGGVVIAGNVLRDPGGTDNREGAIAHIDDAGDVQWARATNWATNDQFFATLVEGQTVYGIGLTRRDAGQGNSNEFLGAVPEVGAICR